jgi:hypothetical protein
MLIVVSANDTFLEKLNGNYNVFESTNQKHNQNNTNYPRLLDWFDFFGVFLTPLSAIYQLYHDDQF